MQDKSIIYTYTCSPFATQVKVLPWHNICIGGIVLWLLQYHDIVCHVVYHYYNIDISDLLHKKPNVIILCGFRPISQIFQL